jgi:peptidylamidoglycolate lyase
LDPNTGRILKEWGKNIFIMPHGLTIDKGDNIWVTDVGLQQVLKFNRNGDLLMRIGTAKVAGNDSTHFDQPTDVAIAADGSFYVSDGYGNSRVVKCSSEGHFLFAWGSKGHKPGEFDLPHGIELDSAGNVYIADRENKRIQVFDPNGNAS